MTNTEIGRVNKVWVMCVYEKEAKLALTVVHQQRFLDIKKDVFATIYYGKNPPCAKLSIQNNHTKMFTNDCWSSNGKE